MPIVTATILPSAARIATTATAAQGTSDHRGMVLIFDVTARAAACTLTPSLQILNPATEEWLTVWTIAAAINSADTTLAYLFYPSGNADAASLYTEAVDTVLPSNWRLSIAHSTTNSITYSVAAYLLP